MGYRKIEKKKPVRRVLQDTTTQNRTFIQNGATANLAIPCWYVEAKKPLKAAPHDVQDHDHYGWPTPTQPDDSCQVMQHPYFYHPYDGEKWRFIRRYIDMSQVYPIHLRDEGYTGVEVAFDDKPSGLTASGEIDDYVVRLYINPMCQSAVKEDVDVPFTVFVTGRRDNRNIRDVAAHGVLRIVAGPITA